MKLKNFRKILKNWRANKKGTKGDDAQEKTSKKQGGVDAKSDKTKDKEIGKLKK